MTVEKVRSKSVRVRIRVSFRVVGVAFGFGMEVTLVREFRNFHIAS